MPWVSRAALIRHIIKKSTDIDIVTLNKIIETYPKRAKNTCDCDQNGECDCIQFGMYDDYEPEYEYYLEDETI